MKAIIIIAAFLMGLPATIQHVNAQDKDHKTQQNNYNYSIGIQPLYLINGGLRVDFEKRLKDPRHVLQVSAIGYLLPEKSGKYWETLLFDDDYYVHKLTGAGLAVDHKWFPFEKADFLYFSGGLSYTNFNVRYDGYEFISYQEDGMTFYEPRWGEIKQIFNKVGANVTFGIQTTHRKPFFVDGYVGLGYSYSFYDKNKYHMDDNLFNVGYRGVTFITGVRIGYRFGK